jgi:hypothetical protein
MNFNTILILIWILFSFVLVIENMIVPLNAYVLIWNMKTWTLAIAGILTWIIIGYGLRGKMWEQPNSDDDSFNF